MNPQLTDVNVSHGNWPWMDFSEITPDAQLRHLRGEGVSEAWISSTEAILFPDPDIPDQRLFNRFADQAIVRLVKTLNPTLPNWRESLDLGLAAGARIVKLYPNYHRYQLMDHAAIHLARTLEERRIPLLIPLRVEDERNQFPLMQVPAVPAHSIGMLADLHPNLTIIALCCHLSEAAPLVKERQNVFVDTSFLDGPDPMAALPAEQMVFGSHSPFLYTRAAKMKLMAADIDSSQRERIARHNAAFPER